MTQNDFPILEFDEDRNALIGPANVIGRVEGIAERCVLCFFSEAMEKVLAEHPHKVISAFAVARHLGVDFGQILYSGDNPGGEEWDARAYNKRTDLREFLLRLTLDICLRM